MTNKTGTYANYSLRILVPMYIIGLVSASQIKAKKFCFPFFLSFSLKAPIQYKGSKENFSDKGYIYIYIYSVAREHFETKSRLSSKRATVFQDNIVQKQNELEEWKACNNIGAEDF